ncbi:galactonate dehydratase [Candidatus Lucifugimonas marina]|uniref:Galactonate dehydratase n=1 Tax=Candidatus Lucifugimonas marina TaxID=3038979 RepID=A0AAJ5ZBF9_9CHLR|nr:galactonate dehydratase [SAR202 cluster bacterium JH639]WFG34269.1 galactonate dehydratase [SAR202 cluster bacterium JH545]WFG38199.1 galactonate dehydratase [SAR202 cluster bacterium JH1073]
MKITDIKTFIMKGGNRNWVFCKVETDEGVHGWGEGTLERHELAVESGIKTLSERLIGRDPTEIERNWQIMYRHGFWRGGVVMGSAMAAIDIALWDVTGKIYNLPVYKMLGGAVRDRVRAYTHAGDLRGGWEAVDQGFTAFKTGGWDLAKNAFHEKDVVDDLHEKIKSMREHLGPDMEIMIDNHGRSRPSVANRQIAAVEEFDIKFFEEPVPPDNLDAMEQIRNAGHNMDIATGERLFFRYGFRDILHRRLTDVIQPDIAHTGGISEIKKIAQMAETEYIKFAPHNPNGPIATAASMHVCATVPNFLILETARDMPWHDKVQTTPITLKDGYFELPTAPGLGTDLDESVFAERPFIPSEGAGNAGYKENTGSWNAEDMSPADV